MNNEQKTNEKSNRENNPNPNSEKKGMRDNEGTSGDRSSGSESGR